MRDDKLVHLAFKVDVRHTFRGGKARRPHLTKGGLVRVVNNHALDAGLVLHQAGPDHGGGKRRRRNLER